MTKNDLIHFLVAYHGYTTPAAKNIIDKIFGKLKKPLTRRQVFR